MDVKNLLLIVCAILAAAIVCRILWLFASRTPVLARSENVDVLGESLPGDPLNPDEHPQGVERMSPFHTSDMRVEYEVGGQRYEHDIEARTIDGVTSTDDMPILWADPEHPERVVRFGPGYWVLALIFVGFAAAAIFQFVA